MLGNLSKSKGFKGDPGEKGDTPNITFKYDKETGYLIIFSDGVLIYNEYIGGTSTVKEVVRIWEQGRDYSIGDKVIAQIRIDEGEVFFTAVLVCIENHTASSDWVIPTDDELFEERWVYNSDYALASKYDSKRNEISDYYATKDELNNYKPEQTEYAEYSRRDANGNEFTEWYLAKDEASATYLSQIEARVNYLDKGDANLTYATKEEVNTAISNLPRASTTQFGVLKVGPNNLGLILDSSGYLKISDAPPAEINAKVTTRPITTRNLDYAVSAATHQELSDDYDPTTLSVSTLYPVEQEKLPVSYGAVKACIGDIEMSLDNIMTKYGIGAEVKAALADVIANQNEILGVSE